MTQQCWAPDAHLDIRTLCSYSHPNWFIIGLDVMSEIAKHNQPHEGFMDYSKVKSVHIAEMLTQVLQQMLAVHI